MFSTTSMKDLVTKYPPDEWDRDMSFAKISALLLPEEQENLGNEWKNLVTRYLSTSLKNHVEPISEAEYKAIFEDFWTHTRPHLFNNPQALIEATEANHNIYIKNWLQRLPDKEKPLLINYRLEDNDTALHIAIKKNNNISLVELFLNEGADINAQGFYRDTALHYAARNNQVEIVTLLLTYKEINLKIKNNDNDAPIHAAAIANAVEVISALIKFDSSQLQIPGRTGSTPFFRALIHGQFKVLDFLLSKGADINQIDRMTGYAGLHHAATKNDLVLMNYLLEKGAGMEIETQDRNKYTPLQLAVSILEKPSVNTAERLIKAGANVNAGDIPPLYLLADNNDSDAPTPIKALAKFLFEEGARISDEYGDENPFKVLGMPQPSLGG